MDRQVRDLAVVSIGKAPEQVQVGLNHVPRLRGLLVVSGHHHQLNRHVALVRGLAPELLLRLGA